MASSLKFGTSGLRGLVIDLEGQAARQYSRAFISHLRQKGMLGSDKVFIGRDFRPSSPAIAKDCAIAVEHEGLVAVDCGALPTPALALHAIAAGSAAIMVTGSHIPADRNGLKFYLPTGEISKEDEVGILAALMDEQVPDQAVRMIDEARVATERYFQRFAAVLPKEQLQGWRIGVFEHSTVARDLLGRVLRYFGADTVPLGRTNGFVPVDTEAFGDAVFSPMAGWLKEFGLDAIVSADGDGDRPLLMDSRGDFVRGDVLGLLTAHYLEARSVVTPVTSNSGIERTGVFESVVRTKVGSPYVMAAMAGASAPVIGFEANGGTFVGAGIAQLPELATRDAVLPLLCTLAIAARDGRRIDEVVAALPLQHAMADRLQDVPGKKSAAFLERLAGDEAYAAAIFAPHGISGMSDIDGLQFRTLAGDLVHFRASGNAPELRCYVEGSTPEVTRSLLDWGMGVAARETA